MSIVNQLGLRKRRWNLAMSLAEVEFCLCSILLLLLHPMASWPSGLVVSVLHISLSIATRITSHRSISHHSVISSIHLLGGLPLGLHPSTMPNATIFNILSSFILATCPNSLSFLDFIMSITVDFLPIIVRTSSFVI